MFPQSVTYLIPSYPSISQWWQLWAQSCTSINHITVTGLLQSPCLIIQWCVVNAAGKHTHCLLALSPRTVHSLFIRPASDVWPGPNSLYLSICLWSSAVDSDVVRLLLCQLAMLNTQDDRMTGWQNDRKFHRQVTVWYIWTNTNTNIY